MRSQPRAAGRCSERHEVPSPETGLYVKEVQLLPPAPDSARRRSCGSKGTSSLVVFTNRNGSRSQAAVQVKQSHSRLSPAAVGGWILLPPPCPAACRSLLQPHRPASLPYCCHQASSGGLLIRSLRGGSAVAAERAVRTATWLAKPPQRLRNSWGKWGIFWQIGLEQTLPASHKPHSAFPRHSP